MKRVIFGLSFLLFFRLQSHEFIAAIFWQSTCYIFANLFWIALELISAKFSLDHFDFSSNFNALEFLVLRDLYISHWQVSTAELKGWQFSTKSQMKSADIDIIFSFQNFWL